MAAIVRVNPATVAQAYRDLEVEGFVSKRHGAGTFAKEVPMKGKNEEMEQQAHELVSTLMSDVARMGVSTGLLRQALSGKLYNGTEK